MNHIILMKYGYHASEEVDSIIKRKLLEIEEKGFCFWGYGGTLLHPLNQVQPFCEKEKVYLLLSFTNSKYFGDSMRANYYSSDKINYQKIPKEINVYGSKKALVFNNLKKVDFDINLYDYEVEIGNSKGKSLADYFKLRVDKVCAVYKETSKIKKMVHIDYIAELVYPYSVFIKEELWK